MSNSGLPLLNRCRRRTYPGIHQGCQPLQKKRGPASSSAGIVEERFWLTTEGLVAAKLGVDVRLIEFGRMKRDGGRVCIWSVMVKGVDDEVSDPMYLGMVACLYPAPFEDGEISSSSDDAKAVMGVTEAGRAPGAPAPLPPKDEWRNFWTVMAKYMPVNSGGNLNFNSEFKLVEYGKFKKWEDYDGWGIFKVIKPKAGREYMGAVLSGGVDPIFGSSIADIKNKMTLSD